jgi:phosphate transport system permease protein
MSTVETTLDTTSLRAGQSGRRGDVVFRWIVLAAGVLVFVVLGAIAVFLVVKALPALRANTASFFTTQQWVAQEGDTSFGIAALLFGTVLTSALALVMAVPVGLGVAIYITQYAPRQIATLLGYVTDMLAAVPSVVYGLWGYYLLLPHLIGTQGFLATYFGWIPLFANPNGLANLFSKSVFGASVVLAIMVLPIIAAISREVLRQVDPTQKEAALALGATRWEMVRMSVLPPSLPGIISAAMLGLGRALGETIAVALVIGDAFKISPNILVHGGNTIAANIANLFGDADDIGRSALIASGLVLFILTLAVNLVARYIILRSGTEERSVV